MARPKVYNKKGFPRGESHHRAKLSCFDISEILRRYANGEPQSRIARSFGVGKTTIWHIVHSRRRNTDPMDIDARLGVDLTQRCKKQKENPPTRNYVRLAPRTRVNRTEAHWVAWILRASSIPYIPEKMFLATVIAAAIVDEENPWRVPVEEREHKSFAPGWFTPALKNYCRALNIPPDELEEEVNFVHFMGRFKHV